ncbi:iron ABC transporter permease [Oscillibacter sp.]|uniref:FecCD family ABC transporter permease n=1 Tax=Oscillibacter sp. TaxID=1945593 RepID=UPI002614DF44|nr:iron ABC transporter permease [Oscillibacter sp.]MDD3346740.1 iron ABC transporter permease [Oscillibacter sp.]
MRILPKFCIRSLPPTSPKGKALVIFLLGAMLCVAAALSLRCGSQDYSLAQLLDALRQGEGAPWRILVHVRFPRTLAALLAGSALALAGALMQAVLNNAMASPNVIGINAGAGFGAMLVSCLLPAAGLLPAASFLGAFGAALFIYALARRAGLSRTTLILAGLAVSSVLTALVNLLTLLYPDTVMGATGFLLGGFSGVTLAVVRGAAVYLAAGAALCVVLAGDLNVLQLGEESAASLGLHVERVRLVSVLSAALLAGGAVSFSGLLGFVGLLVPHMARRLVGGDNRWLLSASALLGGSFVLLCDVLARVLFAPFELPVGIVMSLLGGPFFLYLLLHRRGGRVYA